MYGVDVELRYDTDGAGLFRLVYDTRESLQGRRAGLLDFGPLITGTDTVFGESDGEKGGAQTRVHTTDGR